MSFSLIHIDNKLAIQLTGKDAPGPVYVDFLEGALAYRRQYGGGKKQLIARAVGIKPKQTLTVLDATAGLGRDAFVLALLGCEVTMCERSKILYDVLQDGLQRAEKETWFRALSLTLKNIDAVDYLKNIKTKPDVIYMDPMFPEKTKSALVKKEMRVLREVVGDDKDADELFAIALKQAKKRVVVKRARLAPSLTVQKPSIVFTGERNRFDVYLVET